LKHEKKQLLKVAFLTHRGRFTNRCCTTNTFAQRRTHIGENVETFELPFFIH